MSDISEPILPPHPQSSHDASATGRSVEDTDRPSLEVHPPSDDATTLRQSTDEVASLPAVEAIDHSPVPPIQERTTSYSSQVRYSNIVDPITRPLQHAATGFSVLSDMSLDDKWAPQHVLCLDGGGVRGYSTLLIVQRLMKIVEELERAHPQPAHSSYDTHDRSSVTDILLWGSEEEKAKHNGQFLPCHYFDYMFGTSTGGLIAILLSRLRMSADEALETYKDLAGDIFGHPRLFSVRGPLPWWRSKHNSKKYEAVLKDLIEKKTGREGTQQVRSGAFSRDPTFNSEPSMCRTVCVAYCDAGAAVRLPTLFRSYEHIKTNKEWERNPGPAHAIPIWKVARATSAAWTYFNRMEIDGAEFMDGAFGSNNPSVEAYQEVRGMHNSNDECMALLLSIGTGEATAKPLPAGTFAQAKYFLKAMLNRSLDPEGAGEQLVLLSDLKFPYVRFNVQNDLKSKIKLDEWKPSTGREGSDGYKPSTCDYMTGLTNEYLENGTYKDNDMAKDEEITVDKKLREVAKMLVDARRRRAATARWHIAMGVRYHCTVKKCHNGQKIRNTRADLITHMAVAHPELIAEEKDKHVKNGTLRR